MSELATAKTFQFIGGNLGLDFCNTVGGKRGSIEREYLSSPLQYLAWCEQAGILNREQVEHSLARAGREPHEAAATVHQAIELREAIFRIFKACSAGTKPAATDMGILNQQLSHALCRLRLCRTESVGVFRWKWFIDSDALDQPLGPIAHAAASLLVDEHKLSHVRMCQGDTCGWLFIDSSKNHSRCWCDMRDCGNRAKIRRHRLKQRTQKVL